MEKTILSHLTLNEQYCRKVLPFLKSDYFSEPSDKIAYKLISDYVNQYGRLPTKEALLIELDRVTTNETTFGETRSLISSLSVEDTDIEWLVGNTEQFCKDKAIHNAIMESISIINKDSKKPISALPDLLQNALSVGFNQHIGHDYLEDAKERYAFFSSPEKQHPFDIDLFNKMTNGGFRNKSLNVIMSTTGGGKSLTMTHMASHYLMDGKNVLYITLELAEELISERIDANLMNIPLTHIREMTEEQYIRKVDAIKSKTTGKLIVHEYPPASSSVLDYQSLLSELKLKKGFTPDVIFVDYLNLCNSSRYGASSNAGSYFIVKGISEELRSLAVKQDVPVVSATQVNRAGMSSSDVTMTDVSESAGLTHTVDLLFALIPTDELRALGQIMVKQLKSRYADLAQLEKFVIGMDRERMKLYNVESNAQDIFSDSVPVFDRTPSGDKLKNVEFK